MLECLLFNTVMVAYGDIKDEVMSHWEFNKINSRLDKRYIKPVVVAQPDSLTFGSWRPEDVELKENLGLPSKLKANLGHKRPSFKRPNPNQNNNEEKRNLTP